MSNNLPRSLNTVETNENKQTQQTRHSLTKALTWYIYVIILLFYSNVIITAISFLCMIM